MPMPKTVLFLCLPYVSLFLFFSDRHRLNTIIIIIIIITTTTTTTTTITTITVYVLLLLLKILLLFIVTTNSINILITNLVCDIHTHAHAQDSSNNISVEETGTVGSL